MAPGIHISRCVEKLKQIIQSGKCLRNFSVTLSAWPMTQRSVHVEEQSMRAKPLKGSLTTEAASYLEPEILKISSKCWKS